MIQVPTTPVRLQLSCRFSLQVTTCWGNTKKLLRLTLLEWDIDLGHWEPYKKYVYKYLPCEVLLTLVVDIEKNLTHEWRLHTPVRTWSFDYWFGAMPYWSYSFPPSLFLPFFGLTGFFCTGIRFKASFTVKRHGAWSGGTHRRLQVGREKCQLLSLSEFMGSI